MEEIFYVYVYLDSATPGDFNYGEFREYHFDYEPFMVGKGKGERCCDHLKEYSLKKNSHKNNKIKQILREGLEPIIVKQKENLIECVSFKYEMLLIKLIGRADLGLGPLTNLTDGGEGVSGVSDEECARRSERMIAYHTEHPGCMSGENNPMYGTHPSDETKLKKTKSTKKYYAEHPEICKEISKRTSGSGNPMYGMSRELAPNYGKHFSDEHRAKLSNSHAGEKNHNKGKKRSSESIQKGIETKKLNKEFKAQQ